MQRENMIYIPFSPCHYVELAPRRNSLKVKYAGTHIPNEGGECLCFAHLRSISDTPARRVEGSRAA